MEPDAPDFRGRERLVASLVDRLATTRLLALVGPSGSGKSSAVRAGLVPAVRSGAIAGSQRWFVAEMLPAGDPFGELTEALVRLAPTAPPSDLDHEDGLLKAAAWLLPDEDSELLLVIDQFEELFTLVEDDEQQAAFMAVLRAAATDPRSRVRIVLTLRADFLDRPLAHSGFAEVLRTGTELILPLSADELERAISGPGAERGRQRRGRPARRAGVRRRRPAGRASAAAVHACGPLRPPSPDLGGLPRARRRRGRGLSRSRGRVRIARRRRAPAPASSSSASSTKGALAAASCVASCCR